MEVRRLVLGVGVKNFKLGNLVLNQMMSWRIALACGWSVSERHPSSSCITANVKHKGGFPPKRQT